MDNTIIFSIGLLGSRLISFILVPVYTYYLSTSEYGVVDLVISTVSFFIPFATLSIYEAIIRYSFDNKYSKKEVLSNSIGIFLFSFVVLMIISPIINKFIVLDNKIYIFYIILFLQSLEMLLQQFARGIGKVKVYAINGIVLTFSTGILNVVFIVFLKLNILGYFVATIIAYLISLIILFVFLKLHLYLDIKSIKFNVIKEFIKYSLPLVPNSITYRINNTSNRFFINYYFGESYNGLFAVSSKYPLIISLINSIFTQAWQLSAFEEYNNEGRDSFFSKIFSTLSSILFLTSSLLILLIKPIFSILFSSEYFIAWEPVPFLLIGVIYSSLSGFLGTSYTASKNTIGVFRSTLIGGIVTLILNFLLIPRYGLIGAGLSSMISMFVIFLYRYIDTKKYVTINIKVNSFFLQNIIVLIQSFLLFANNDVSIIFSAIFSIAIIFLNIKEVKNLFKFTIRYINRRR